MMRIVDEIVRDPSTVPDRLPPRRRTVAVLAIVVAVTGCSADDEGATSATTIAAATGSSMTGYLLVVDGQPTRLCDELDGEPPSACSGGEIVVDGLDPAELPPAALQAAGGARWSTTPITLAGDRVGDHLTVPPMVKGPAIRGRALAGPTCPVETSPPNPECAPVAVPEATMAIVDAGGATVATAVTDATGRFALAVAPGTYTVEPGPVETLMGGAPPVLGHRRIGARRRRRRLTTPASAEATAVALAPLRRPD